MLSDPELPNLTLTDLPGLVRAVGDSEVISRIAIMVRRYMQMERTIVIAVVPTNVDAQGSDNKYWVAYNNEFTPSTMCSNLPFIANEKLNLMIVFYPYECSSQLILNKT
jgi:hypothetical protein